METTQNEHLDWNFPQQFYNQLELLFTRPNIQIPDQYIRKQDGIHLSSIQMVFKYWTIWHPTSFQPFEYQPSCNIQIPTVHQNYPF